MKYDKIRGKSVAECMMKLRSAYGSQAIILSTREVQEGGLLGSGLFSRKLYEIDFMLPEEGAGASAPSPAGMRGGRDRTALGRALFDAAATARQTRESVAGQTLSGAAESDSTGLSARRSPSRALVPDAAAQSDSARNSPIPPLGPGAAEAPGGLLQDRSGAGPGTPENLLKKSFESPLAGRSPEEARLEREALDLLLSESPASEGADRSDRESSIRPLAVSSRKLATDDEFTTVPASEADSGFGLAAGPDATGVPEGESGIGRAFVKEQVSAIGVGDERFGRILHRIRGRLLSSQVSGDFADRFLEQVDHSLSRVERAEYRNVEERSLEKLAEVIRTVPDIAPRHGECQAVMLMGPTGSGKTTSLAKLAARYHIMQGREVSIYSLDHYRLAATEQLKTYAGVMDVPFFAPLTPADFSEYLRRDGAELMLIDTSGIGYRDLDRIDQLQEYVDACEVRLEKHLVLAANTNAGMLEKILLAYDRIGLDKIILTKLDESDFLGAFIELADKYNRPFSFLMNGQDVPGSILEAESLELARMVLSGAGGSGDGMDAGT